MPEINIEIQINPKLEFLDSPKRYKVLYGGRGSGKSVGIADHLLLFALQCKERILCTREFQSSIAESVHRLLSDRIYAHRLDKLFKVSNDSIVCIPTKSDFLFKGLRRSIHEIKSLEGVTKCWVEEAQRISRQSLNILIPTIRKENSEIWFSLNPEEEDGAVYHDFVLTKRENAIVKQLNWRDNPWFPKVLEEERQYCLQYNPQMYDHIWEGQPLKISDAVIFKDKYEIADFDEPTELIEKGEITVLLGMDFGFSQDPNATIRGYIHNRNLYITHEHYQVGLEIDKIKDAISFIPGVGKYTIKCDNSRPETIVFLRKQGLRTKAADKWPNSVEEGVEFMRNFKRIYIHPRCKHTADEFRSYSYKVDKMTNEILPVIDDKNNHAIDAIRYMLDAYIRSKSVPRGNLTVTMPF